MPNGRSGGSPIPQDELLRLLDAIPPEVDLGTHDKSWMGF